MRFRPCFSCSIAALFALSLTLRAAGPDVQIEMKNVRLHAADGIVLDVANLRGTMVSRTAGAPPVFDDQRSFVLHLRHAELSLDVLPPPEIAGRLVRVTVSGNRIVQVFDDGAKAAAPLTRPSPGARNYVYFGGGDIRFGKLTMHDADLQLIDSDPKDAFDFFPARYSAQLVAGYSKNTPAKGSRPTCLTTTTSSGREKILNH